MKKKNLKVAYQGTKGAYSEMAIKSFFGEDVTPIGLELSEQVAEAVLEKEAQLGILPVENSIIGNVDVNLDVFSKYNIFAIHEVYLPINHCLLASKGVLIEQIKHVYSHPVALAQCRSFLNRHHLLAIPVHDTAGACLEISKKKSQEFGAIGSALCAEYYDLDVIENHIQSTKNNITRFLIFQNAENSVEKELKQEKTSIIFKAKHAPGSLLKCLQVFSAHDINLTKLESRPIPENPFAYNFFMDFLGGISDIKTQKCLDELKQFTDTIKVYGSYSLGKI